MSMVSSGYTLSGKKSIPAPSISARALDNGLFHLIARISIFSLSLPLFNSFSLSLILSELKSDDQSWAKRGQIQLVSFMTRALDTHKRNE